MTKRAVDYARGCNRPYERRPPDGSDSFRDSGDSDAADGDSSDFIAPARKKKRVARKLHRSSSFRSNEQSRQIQRRHTDSFDSSTSGSITGGEIYSKAPAHKNKRVERALYQSSESESSSTLKNPVRRPAGAHAVGSIGDADRITDAASTSDADLRASPKRYSTPKKRAAKEIAYAASQYSASSHSDSAARAPRKESRNGRQRAMGRVIGDAGSGESSHGRASETDGSFEIGSNGNSSDCDDDLSTRRGRSRVRRQQDGSGSRASRRRAERRRDDHSSALGSSGVLEKPIAVPKMKKTSFRSWRSFETYFTAFRLRTNQMLSIRGGVTTEKRNKVIMAGLKSKYGYDDSLLETMAETKCIPDRFSYYTKRITCTHAGDARIRANVNPFANIPSLL